MNVIFPRLVIPLLLVIQTGSDAGENPQANAEITAPALTLEPRCTHAFGNNSVFQQNMTVPVWGWSLPGAKVEVAFDNQKKSTTAAADGAWRAALDPMPADKLTSLNAAPAGRSLTIAASLNGKTATTTFSNILIGEVWHCAGQSNMAGPFGRAPYPHGSNKEADYPALRNLQSEWTVCTPEAVGKFSRVAVSFAREIQRELMVPVGLIQTAVGGTRIESWTRTIPLEKDGKPIAAKYRHYETKIQPLAGYAMRGTLWYQGEGNQNDGRNYLPKLKQLISEWRADWNQGDFPFYFVQLAPIGESPADKPAGGDGRAEIRQAQVEALAIPNTAMAVTIDIGDKKEHPINKYDIGLRLSRIALHRDYGRKNLVPCGPLYRSHRIEGDTIRIAFQYAENGLMLAKKDGFDAPKPTPGAPIPWLSIQSKDGTWRWADGKIDGSELLVSSKEVKDPVAVRFAYTNQPTGFNLYNTDGLPASPFTTCGY